MTEKKIPRDTEAVQRLIQLARSASPGAPLYVIAIAAISNVASALLQAPDIRHNIVVIWLGGNAVGWLLHPDAMLNQVIPAPRLDNQGAWHTAPDRHPVTYVRFVERNIILRDFFTRWAAQQG
ncbi:hypothetical protein [Chimaeribacter californicus]|uniref:hypothetical protein n=1 Tax=Chimaeribacter californicus TaxID=2060067 RepID=UPI00158B9E85|nr:hypothetical protein [Chimaeribacter californicus]